MDTAYAYDQLATIYDRFQEKMDVKAWTQFLTSTYAMYASDSAKANPQGMSGQALALDLGCGTGKVSLEMAKEGFFVFAIDFSEEMLEEAAYRAQEYFVDEQMNMQFLQMDLREDEIPLEANFVYTSLDTFNHLSPEDFFLFLERVAENVLPGGVLLFDLLRWEDFQKSFGREVYYLVDKEQALLWQNAFDEEKRSNTASISIFLEEDSGLYRREDLEIQEFYHDPQVCKRILEENGFRVEELCVEPSLAKAIESERRHFLLALREG